MLLQWFPFIVTARHAMKDIGGQIGLIGAWATAAP